MNAFSLRARLARSYAGVVRYSTLRTAEAVFRNAESGTVLARPYLGYQLHLDLSRTNTHRCLYLEGERNVAERELLRSLLKPGMSVVDVGANIGYYALLFHRCAGEGGSIHCLEPEPANLAELRRNIDRNGLQNVTVHAVAAGDQDGVARFSLGINGEVSERGEVEVPLRKLDSLFTGRVDFIKVDVEGYEGAVLEGAARLIAEQKPVLFVEIHRQLTTGHSYPGIVEFLRRHYTRVEFYEKSPEDSLWEKTAIRYFGARGVRRIADGDRLIQECVEGRRWETFWAVCQAA